MAANRLQQRSLEQEFLAEDIRPDPFLVDAARLLESHLQHLAGVIPLVKRRLRVETLVALQADQVRLQEFGQHLREFGLAYARFALQEDRLAQPQRQKHGRGQGPVRNVATRG